MLDGTEIIHLERAELLIDVARWREAIHELNKYLTCFPDDYNALCQISRCHYELSELKNAMSFANQAVESNPENEWAYRLKSLIHRENNENDQALVEAEKCVQKAPQENLSLQTLAYAQIRKSKLREAEITVKSMLEVAPESSATLEACGYLALKKEQWSKAELSYLSALKIDPQSANSLNNLGVVYLNQFDLKRKKVDKIELRDKSIECFERAIKANPNYQLAHDNLKLAKEKSVNSVRYIFVFLLIGFLINVISRGGKSLFGVFNPYSPNSLILLLNIYFLIEVLLLICWRTLTYFKETPEFLKEVFRQRRSILILLFSQLIPTLVLFGFGLFSPKSRTPFSIIATFGFFTVSLICLRQFFIYNQNKHLKNDE